MIELENLARRFKDVKKYYYESLEKISKNENVVNFQWRAVPHGTCNFGWHLRPILRVTGFLKDESIVNRINQWEVAIDDKKSSR